MKEDFRLEKDSLGSIKVPIDKLWGAQTQRSIKNFSVGDEFIPLDIIYSLTLIKKAAAITNFDLGILESSKKDLIILSCDDILNGMFDDQFPLKIWQTGSGTQSNMNTNEVIANRVRLGNRKLKPKELHSKHFNFYCLPPLAEAVDKRVM